MIPLLLGVTATPLAMAQQFLGIALVITASVYVGFAVWQGSPSWWLFEAGGVVIYGLFYGLSCWVAPLWLAGGWALHPVWDIALHRFGPGHGLAPDWYAIACVSFDFAVAVYWICRLRSEAASNGYVSPQMD